MRDEVVVVPAHLLARFVEGGDLEPGQAGQLLGEQAPLDSLGLGEADPLLDRFVGAQFGARALDLQVAAQGRQEGLRAILWRDDLDGWIGDDLERGAKVLALGDEDHGRRLRAERGDQ